MGQEPIADTESRFHSIPDNHPASQYSTLSPRQLLEEVQVASMAISDPLAQQIYTAFYYRYFRYLSTVARNSLAFVYSEKAREEIVHDALLGFFKNSCRLKLPNDKADEECDRIIRAYLGQLVCWRAADAKGFQRSIGADVLDEEKWQSHLTAASAGYDGLSTSVSAAKAAKLEQVRAWLNELPEMDRDVVQMYFLDDHVGQKSERLPEGVAPLLAKKHSTTTSNLRHIKRKLEAQFRAKFGNT